MLRCTQRVVHRLRVCAEQPGGVLDAAADEIARPMRLFDKIRAS